MVSPPDAPLSPGSFDDLRQRLIQRMQQDGVDKQIVDVLQQTFEAEFSQARIVLSRADRVRLFQQVSIAVLTDVQNGIDRMA